MIQTPVIELQEVSVVYNAGTPNEVVALNNVSLRVSRGETIVILGGNGSGKSTLLKAIAGTAPVKTGTVLLHGRDVTRWPSYRRSKRIGYVHQDPMLGTCPSLTVHENFQLSASERWWLPTPFSLQMRNEDRVSVQRTGLPLEQKASTPVSMLSGGQRQAIALCLAFGSTHPILLLDEFTASLDETTSNAVMCFLAERSAEVGATVLIVMHDLRKAQELGKRNITFTSGSLDVGPGYDL